MNKISTVICFCGSGTVTSLLISMNIQSYLDSHDIQGVEVQFSTIRDLAKDYQDTLIVVVNDFQSLVKDFPNKIILRNIMDKEELFNKLDLYFSE